MFIFNWKLCFFFGMVGSFVTSYLMGLTFVTLCDEGGGGQKSAKKPWRHLWTAPHLI